MTNSFYQYLQKGPDQGGFYACLIDPDNQRPEDAAALAVDCEKAGADFLMIGGSLMIRDHFHETVKEIKERVELPVVVFPGIFDFVCPHADALFLLSMISSRNPEMLIGEQVRAAPAIRRSGIEAIGTAYMLVESGNLTSVQFMSHSLPIPRNKVDIAVAHALAGMYLGMRIIYMDAGSGAAEPVTDRMISAVGEVIDIPLIIGGGIRTPDQAAAKVAAGANVVVTGTILENGRDTGFIREMADAVHTGGKRLV